MTAKIIVDLTGDSDTDAPPAVQPASPLYPTVKTASAACEYCASSAAEMNASANFQVFLCVLYNTSLGSVHVCEKIWPGDGYHMHRTFTRVHKNNIFTFVSGLDAASMLKLYRFLGAE